MSCCSVCNKVALASNEFQKQGSHHLRLNQPVYFLTNLKKNIKGQKNAILKIFCEACFQKGHYFNAFMEYYPHILQNQVNEITNKNKYLSQFINADFMKKYRQVAKYQNLTETYLSEDSRKSFQELDESIQNQLASLNQNLLIDFLKDIIQKLQRKIHRFEKEVKQIQKMRAIQMNKMAINSFTVLYQERKSAAHLQALKKQCKTLQEAIHQKNLMIKEVVGIIQKGKNMLQSLNSYCMDQKPMIKKKVTFHD